MDFLNTPVSEVWKATKRTFADIIDRNDGVRESGNSSQRNDNSQDDPELHTVAQSSHTGRHTRSSWGRGKGRHKSSSSNQDVELPDGERENRPVDLNVTDGPAVSGAASQLSTSSDSLDFAEVQPTSLHVQESQKQSMPKIKSKDKHSSDKERYKNAWAKFRLGYLGRGFNSSDLDDGDGSDSPGSDKSPILPSRLEKASPAYASSGSVGNSAKGKSRSSRRSRGEIVTKSLDLRSRFRSNSSDRATMRRREREERERTRRTSYTRSASYDATEEEEASPAEESSEDQAEKVKTKLLSMWNNVKYGWTVKTKTSFNIHKPIWFLGKCYHQRPEDPDPVRPPGMDTVRSMVIEMFKQDFSSRLWMTYRREFPTLAGSNFTSDCGWGCMLRSGQMLLAHSLIMHFMGRGWNVYNPQNAETQAYHRQIIRWFGDQPLDMSPFSVHRLVSIGQVNGKKVGDWYGPASVAHILKEAMDTAPELNPLLGQLCVYVAQDCTVYKQDVIDLCRSRKVKSPQPVYKDVCPDTNTPTTSQHQDVKQHPHHEQLQRSSSISKEPHHASDLGPRTQEKVMIPPRQGERHLGEETQGGFASSYPTGHFDLPKSSHATGNRTSSKENPRFIHNNGVSHSSLPHQHHLSDLQGKSNGTAHNVEMKDIAHNFEDEDDVFHSEDTDRTSHTNGQDTNPNHLRHLQTQNVPGVKSDNVTTDYPQQSCSHQSPPLPRGLHPGPHPGPTSDGSSTQLPPPPVDEMPTRTDEEDAPPWCSVVILIPVRLGGDEVNPVYIRPIQSLFTLESCIGIIGGKPKHSLYFVGFQEEKLIHLDPHYCQQVVDMRSRDFPLWSFHCMSPRKMSISKMDPSCTVGFYLRTEEDFNKFCDVVPQVVSPLGSQACDYPMFIIREGRCGDWQYKNMNTNRPERYLRVRHVDENGRLVAPVKESEDFVLLDS